MLKEELTVHCYERGLVVEEREGLIKKIFIPKNKMKTGKKFAGFGFERVK